MSKEIIKNLTASEAICYVCHNQIESLAELSNIYSGKECVPFYKEMEKLCKAVNYEVVSIKASHEKSQRFRHIDCDPFDRLGNGGQKRRLDESGGPEKRVQSRANLKNHPCFSDPIKTFTVEDL